jgi:MFS transporter, putative metabolite:H+ symporter
MSPLAENQVERAGDRGPAAARLDRLPVSRWHRRLITVVGVVTFFDLYEVFLGGTLAAVLTRAWHLDTTGSALVIASVFAGMFVGASGLGMAADRFGRRRVLLVTLVLYSIFSLLTAFAPNLTGLIALRVLAGIPLGAELALVGTYLSEFLPRRSRGRGLAWAFTVGFCGIPAAAFLGGQFVANRHLIIDGWRWLLIFGAVGALGAWVFRRDLPESPRWLIAHGRVKQAEQLVARIEDTVRRHHGRPLPPLELGMPSGSSQPDDPVTIGVMFSGRYRRRTIMLWIFHILQTVGYYGFGTLAPLVLVSKGFTVTQSLGYTAASFLGYPIGAALAIPVIERIERKTLIIVAALTMAACGLVFGWSTGAAVIVVSGFTLTVASNVFAAGFHTYQPELFPTAVRAGAVGIAYSLSRVVAMVLPFIALTVLKHCGASGVYLGSAAALVILCVNVAVLGPPSTGRPLEEVSV